MYRTATDDFVKDPGLPAERVEIHAGFAIEDRFIDIQLTFCTDGRFWVYHQSDPVKPMVRTKMTKDILAEDPGSHVLPGLGRLTLGWDHDKAKFLVKLNGMRHEELKPFVKDVQISRNKVVHTNEGNVRQSLWFILYGITSVVV